MIWKSGYRFSEKTMLIKRLDRRFDRSCSERLAERAGPFKSAALRLVGSLVMLMFTPATISTGRPADATADRIRTDRQRQARQGARGQCAADSYRARIS